MIKFSINKLKDLQFSMQDIQLLVQIHEAKGRLASWTHSPQREKMQSHVNRRSVESSLALEGVVIPEQRQIDLLSERTLPINSDEYQLIGYHKTLKSIQEDYNYLPLKMSTILQIHRGLFPEGSGITSGKVKQMPNYIIEPQQSGKQLRYFQTTSPEETEATLHALCDAYREALGEEDVFSLLLVPAFINDFLCILPFEEGSGRLSRLLTTLLLCQQGYTIGLDVSLEEIILQTQADYEASLTQSRQGWHSNTSDVLPFVRYILSVLKLAYDKGVAQMQVTAIKQTALEQVRHLFEQQVGRLTKADILIWLPHLGVKAVERALTTLVSQQIIVKHGSGRNTFYVKD